MILEYFDYFAQITNYVYDYWWVDWQRKKKMAKTGHRRFFRIFLTFFPRWFIFFKHKKLVKFHDFISFFLIFYSSSKVYFEGHFWSPWLFQVSEKGEREYAIDVERCPYGVQKLRGIRKPKSPQAKAIHVECRQTINSFPSHCHVDWVGSLIPPLLPFPENEQTHSLQHFPVLQKQGKC